MKGSVEIPKIKLGSTTIFIGAEWELADAVVPDYDLIHRILWLAAAIGERQEVAAEDLDQPDADVRAAGANEVASENLVELVAVVVVEAGIHVENHGPNWRGGGGATGLVPSQMHGQG